MQNDKQHKHFMYHIVLVHVHQRTREVTCLWLVHKDSCWQTWSLTALIFSSFTSRRFEYHSYTFFRSQHENYITEAGTMAQWERAICSCERPSIMFSPSQSPVTLAPRICHSLLTSMGTAHMYTCTQLKWKQIFKKKTVVPEDFLLFIPFSHMIFSLVNGYKTSLNSSSGYSTKSPFQGIAPR